MTKKTLLVGLLAMFSVTTFAQNAAKKIKDARTNPDLYYLQDGQQTSSLELLPTPPQPGSIQFLYDEAQYQWGKMQRNTPRGDQAAADARVGGDGVPNAFSEAFGYTISPKTTPEIYKLVTNLIEDAINSCNKAISIFSLENNETMRSLTLSYLAYLKEKNSKEPQQ